MQKKGGGLSTSNGVLTFNGLVTVCQFYGDQLTRWPKGGAEPHVVTKQRSGDLMVELRSKEQERKLERVSSFLDIPVTVRPHKSLNTCRGVIKHSDFQDCTEEEFVDEFPDVIHARRIHVRKGDVRIPTNTIVLTFDCPRPPTSLRAGYLTVPVRPYIPFPMRCFKCHKFGHGKDKCRRPNALCGRCGKEHADQHQCTAAAHCINCKGDDLCGSNHFPIFLKSHAEDNTTHPRYNFKKANWNLFGDLCSRSIDLKILESDCPVELFTGKITAAAREAIPPYVGGWGGEPPESSLVYGGVQTSNPGQEEGPKEIFQAPNPFKVY